MVGREKKRKCQTFVIQHTPKSTADSKTGSHFHYVIMQCSSCHRSTAEGTSAGLWSNLPLQAGPSPPPALKVSKKGHSITSLPGCLVLHYPPSRKYFPNAQSESVKLLFVFHQIKPSSLPGPCLSWQASNRACSVSPHSS